MPRSEPNGAAENAGREDEAAGVRVGGEEASPGRNRLVKSRRPSRTSSRSDPLRRMSMRSTMIA